MSIHAWARLCGAFALSAAAVAMPAAAQSFNALYVFGDSLADTGNNYTTFGGQTGPNPPTATSIPTLPYAFAPPAGAPYLPDYSNGPTWVAGFAAGLGLSSYAAPSLLGGGNYAYGGARMVTDGSAPFPLPPNFPASVATQLATYLSSGPAVSASALYVIAGGGNDVRDVGLAVAGGAPLVSTTAAAAAAYAAAAVQMVGSLKSAGAAHIVVWDVPDVGTTPAAGAGAGPAAAAASYISAQFNFALGAALSGSGAQIFDIYGLIDDMVAHPLAYGYSNVTQACGFAGNGCDPASSLFWDGIHPTTYADTIVAGAMLAAVPEPASLWLLSAGVLVVIARRRRPA